jgi:hypothetical protein
MEFPYGDEVPDYAAGALKKHWSRLHAGDREPWPDAAAVKAMLAANPGAEGAIEGAAKKPAALATALQDAWRTYHRGDFRGAHEAGIELGPMGYSVAHKAVGVYATYLEDDDARARALLEAAIERAERGVAAAPDYPNAHYFHAFVLGRYSQLVSVARALSEGLAGKVQKSLERTLELEPDHAEAHVAMGVYHAEVIDKMGAMVARVTYGVSRDVATDHFERALALTPTAPVALLEYANGLVLMHGKKGVKRARALYESAAASKPADAMERLDVEQARIELE